MRIGGLIKRSVVDWPGKLSVVVFTKGCNFRCSYCHNSLFMIPELMNRTTDLPVEVVFKYLMLEKEMIEGVVISGGEPTIQSDLPWFIGQIKRSGFKVRLNTNGTNPEMLGELISGGLVDYIAMDIKAGFTDEEYEKITGIQSDGLIVDLLQSVQLIKSSGIDHRFTTTILPGIHSAEAIDELSALLKGSDYNAQKFHVGQPIETVSCLQKVSCPY